MGLYYLFLYYVVVTGIDGDRVVVVIFGQVMGTIGTRATGTLTSGIGYFTRGEIIIVVDMK